MDLRQKALWGFVGVIIVTMVVLGSLSFFVIMGNYRNLESDNVRSDLGTVSKGIDSEILTLKSNAPDWGAWDDTYDFVLGKKPEYASVNLVNTTFRTLRANFIIITNREGKIQYGQAYDLPTNSWRPLRADLVAEIGTGRILEKTTAGTSGVSGFVNLPGGPVILSAFPVLHSNYTGPEQGMVIIGRYVDDTEIAHIAEGTIPSLSIRSFDRLAVPREDLPILVGAGEAAVVVRPIDENTVQGEQILSDIFGKDNLILTIQIPRDIYQQGKDTIFIFIMLELVLLLILSILCIIIFDRSVLSRMSTISTDITGITEKMDRSGRVRTIGNDELSRLASAMNSLLDQIEKNQADLQESEQKFREIFNSVNDSIELYEMRSDGLPGKYTEVNDVTCRMLQYTRDELLGLSPLFFSTGSYNKALEDIGKEILTLGYSRFETERRRKDGTIIFVEIDAHVTALRGRTLVLAVVRDITDRKIAEKTLKQLIKKLNILSSITRHDILNQLTTLRGYLELSSTMETDPKLRTFIDRESAAAIAIQEQISFTRDYENIGVHSPQWQDVNKTLLRAISPLRPLSVNLSVGIEGTEMYADPLLEKVFYNLVDNAIRHGGALTTISFSQTETPEGLIILCEDDGEGIPADEKENIFNRKYYKNTGFGLFLVREVLGITGISIRETGEPGKGARFELSVPKGMYRFHGDDTTAGNA